MNPKARKLESSISGSLRATSLTLLGKQKYGNPSMISTKPNTERKYTINYIIFGTQITADSYLSIIKKLMYENTPIHRRGFLTPQKVQKRIIGLSGLVGNVF
jgi:hypothetical protein